MLLLCKTLIKRNGAFTFGILVMYVLSVALSFFAFSFTDSAKATISDFCDSYGLPDAVYFTEPLDVSIKTEAENIEKIRGISDRFVYDVSVLDETGEIYYLRAFRYSDGEMMKNKTLKSVDIDDSKKGVFLSWGIADHSNFDAGSKIVINAPSGPEELVIEAIVANPETIHCQRDSFSISENFQFGYLYVPDNEFDRLFGTADQANQWNVYFDGKLSERELGATEQKLDSFFGNKIISKEYRENSESINSLMAVIDIAGIICIVVPAFIFLVTIIFGCLFLSRIFDDQKHMIGILRSVGFSKSGVVRIFVLYVFLIVFASFVLGLPIGYVFLNLCIKGFIEENMLGNAIFVIKTMNIVIIFLIVVLLAFGTCLLVIKKILNIDPAQATSGARTGNDNVIEGLSKVNTEGFFKLSLLSILKNKGRFIAGTLCVASCITFITLLAGSVVSNNHPLTAVYQERFCYDSLVKANDDGTLEQALEEMEELNRTEPQILFSAVMSFRDCSQDITVHAISDFSVLDTPRDADDNIVYPQDGIVLDEMSAKENGIQIGDTVKIDGKKIKVSAIAREYTKPIQYISLLSAKDLGFGDVNAFAITLKNGTDLDAVKSKINSVSPQAVVISRDLQILDAKEGVALTEMVLELFAILTFFIGILIILNMTVIQFNERIFDYAVLRSLGVSIMRISTVILIEEAIRALIGVIISYPAAYALINLIFSLISSKTQQFTPIAFNEIFLLSGVISIIFVFAGWIASVLLIKKMNYLSIMNRND